MMANDHDDTAGAARVRAAAIAIWLATFGAVLAIGGVVVAFHPDIPATAGGSMIAAGLVSVVFFGYRARLNNS